MNFNNLNLPNEIEQFYKTAKLNEISDSLIFGYNVFMNCKKETIRFTVQLHNQIIDCSVKILYIRYNPNSTLPEPAMSDTPVFRR